MRVSCHRPKTTSGAAMLVAMMLVFASGVAITAWMFMLSTRLRQSEANDDTLLRHIEWGNTSAINLTYSHYKGYRDASTQAAVTGQLTTGSGASTAYWGGVDAAAWSSLSAFRTLQRPMGATFAYPYNNIRPLDTSDHGIYFERTDSTSDTSQSEHLSLYNYLMTYPAPLLGDLLIIHKAASGATGTYSMNQNTTINGRVVIWDKTATAGNLRSNAVLCRYTSGTSAVTTKNAGGTASLMPDNWSIGPSATAGNSSASTSPAVTDGTLNMANNANFTPGSIYHKAVAGTYTAWNGLGSSGTTTDPSYTTQTGSPTYAPPGTSPYNYTVTGQLNTVWVNLLNASLKSLVITGNFEQVVLVGSTTQTEFNTADGLTPIYILIDEDKLRDIRFVGENNRRIILAIRRTTANTVYMGFSGTSSVVGGPLRWRCQLVNEFGALWFAPPTGTNISITGGIRTNWQFNCTDATTTQRISLNEDTAPGLLETMMPRDSTFTSYVLVR